MAGLHMTRASAAAATGVALPDTHVPAVEAAGLTIECRSGIAAMAWATLLLLLL